jgi:transcriptional regulator with XRE-family HTH domain
MEVQTIEPPRPSPAPGTVGEMLRDWRLRRRYSQLALALDADVSARHLSFLETGRARPSREMLHRLAERLEIPHRERNTLLVAAGYAPEHRERRLDDAALREVRAAVELMLAGLDPCPALAVDRHWNLLAANPAAGRLLAGIAAALTVPSVNVLRVSLHPDGLAPRIANLPEWRGHLLERLRREVETTADPVLAGLLEELRGYPAPAGTVHRARPAPGGDGAADVPVAIPLRLRTDEGLLSFLSTTTVFGTAVDVTAAELVIEALLPADAHTAEALRRLAAVATPAG